jgi:hypothetical protein
MKNKVVDVATADTSLLPLDAVSSCCPLHFEGFRKYEENRGYCQAQPGSGSVSYPSGFEVLGGKEKKQKVCLFAENMDRGQH